MQEMRNKPEVEPVHIHDTSIHMTSTAIDYYKHADKKREERS